VLQSNWSDETRAVPHDEVFQQYMLGSLLRNMERALHMWQVNCGVYYKRRVVMGTDAKETGCDFPDN